MSEGQNNKLFWFGFAFFFFLEFEIILYSFVFGLLEPQPDRK